MQKKVLIVNDCKEKRQKLRKLVEGHPCVVDEVCDGERAFNYCMIKLPDIIMLDSDMPNLNGIEFLRLFRDTLGQFQRIPHVIYCAEEEQHDTHAEAIALGVKICLPYTTKDKDFKNHLAKYMG